MSIKYLFVTGGVVSSLGKGITAASIGQLLEKRGLHIAMLKLDPYLNVDPGTMNPFQHGEVYVTDDGAETDLDLGHYYRYTHSPLSKASNATSGQIYDTVIKKERKGEYLGKTVQVIPHVTDEIQERILACSRQDPNIDVVIVEIGGTIGDIESLPFLEAIRQFCYERPKDCLNIHLTYVPFLKAAGEVKTKPTQHSVQSLRAIGIIPDIILCRCESPLSEEIKAKISLFCSVPKESVFDECDVVTSVYEVPVHLQSQQLDTQIGEKLGLCLQKSSPLDWQEMQTFSQKPSKERVVVGIVGKYMDHQDAYKSVFEALDHSALHAGVDLEIRKIESDRLNADNTATLLTGCHGCLVPGGFGERGWEGKILTAQYCRTEQVPYFGLCLGMQVLVVEAARHLLGLPEANSTEIDPNTPHPVISLLSEQKGIKNLGGTMRLGSYPCILDPNSQVYRIYQKPRVSERHRHRYECNNLYKEDLEKAGLCFSGILEKQTLCEIVEISSHPWMIGVQFHPEFQSRPLTPHPLFLDFMQTLALRQKASLPSISL